jgi:hypothetical protein
VVVAALFFLAVASTQSSATHDGCSNDRQCLSSAQAVESALNRCHG